MSPVLLLGGAAGVAGLAAYLWWSSKSSSIPVVTPTPGPSVAPSGGSPFPPGFVLPNLDPIGMAQSQGEVVRDLAGAAVMQAHVGALAHAAAVQAHTGNTYASSAWAQYALGHLVPTPPQDWLR